MNNSEIFDELIDKAQRLADSQENPDEFVIQMLKQLQNRKKSNTVCEGCVKQVKFLIEKLETGSFPWEKDIDSIQKNINSLKDTIESLKEKHANK